MICLNDYLFSGNTVLKILHQYSNDLRNSAKETRNNIDLAHSNFLIQIIELLEHNDFLTSQSQRIKEFYKFMTREYPFLAFTFKGRIKSLIRAEEKFNGYILEFIYNYYKKNGAFPSEAEIKSKLNFRDLIAYRIVISMPVCHIKKGDDRSEVEKKYLYEIANALPEFLEERGFSAEIFKHLDDSGHSDLLKDFVRPYYHDSVATPRSSGYQSLHITFYDNLARCYTEVQLRTKDMDDYAEIGEANHFGYEKSQEERRSKHDQIPSGECVYFDEAYERLVKLQGIDLAKIDVNMFKAINNQLINDGCGLFRGRQILPFEHLSRFQNDLID
ncbi:guanosine polyphosphate pyrophosphohydrolase [Fibrobacter sp. UBA2449]|uniref:guanosine polyphosphate pyrophosphohydrolase n=1 Tax=Fibrobacter sp. UBA2449 TaxID=1946529 RepID=UPI0025B9878D|nr:guanosine polyphosphate pyrophosphohydrolase [Fibrobacter sp. UBA2449]